MSSIIKLIVGRYKYPVQVTTVGDRFEFRFPYNKDLLNIIKSLQGRRWHPKTKHWSAPINRRNIFTLNFYQGIDVYERFDASLVDYTPSRNLYINQIEMVRSGLTKRHCIWAAEMGLGKSLSAIETAEYVNEHVKPLDSSNCWYIGPKSGAISVGRELEKWDSKVGMRLLTYEGLVKLLANGDENLKAPFFIIMDESVRIKTPTAKRSQACLFLMEQAWQEYGDDFYLIEMCGTPAPKSPTDWWHQAEVAQPGYLAEPTIYALRDRLAIMEERTNQIGAKYPHLVAWKDDSNKCNKCGQVEAHQNHTIDVVSGKSGHPFQPSINEVSKLYQRLKGLVTIQLKKDCTDLPDKQYEIIQVKPTVEMLRTYQTITKTADRAITALIMLRELSDGFQYNNEETGTQTCTICHGKGEVEAQVPIADINYETTGHVSNEHFKMEIISCYKCDGTGQETLITRCTNNFGTPKDEVFFDQLDAHEDIGRLVVWGGFQATLDRLKTMAQDQGWSVLMIDGRGYRGFGPKGESLDANRLLNAMDMSHKDYKDSLTALPKLVVIAHPDAGGEGLTFTASPTALYFSNSFNGRARMQSEDRIHRHGMDKNRGAKIIDIEMFPVDRTVLQNLQAKKRLQDITLGQLLHGVENK